MVGKIYKYILDLFRLIPCARIWSASIPQRVCVFTAIIVVNRLPTVAAPFSKLSEHKRVQLVPTPSARSWEKSLKINMIPSKLLCNQYSTALFYWRPILVLIITFILSLLRIFNKLNIMNIRWNYFRNMDKTILRKP